MSRRDRTSSGQVALENLMVYAIIILTILVGLLILWQMGAFKSPAGKKGSVGFSQLTPTDWIVSNDNRIYLRLKNEAEGDVRVLAYGINVTVGRVECRLGPGGEEEIAVGTGKTVMINCDNPPTIGQEYEIGGYFEADVAINYTNLLTNKNHESIGRIYGTVEGYGIGNASITATTTTIGTTVTTCPPTSCTNIGTVDDTTECDYANCTYCRLSGECHQTCSCGQTCTVDSMCSDSSCGTQNLCTICNTTLGRCMEPANDCNKPCIVGMGECHISCDYCYTRWDKTYCLEGQEFCGKPCTPSPYDTYQECAKTCMWCNITTGNCSQGSCGKKCTADAECDKGCHYCNLTTQACEAGDCGKECADGTACNLGCDKCQSGKCIKTPIAVTINAVNESGGKFVAMNQTIFLNVSAQADRGVQRIIASRGVENPYEDCQTLADDVMNMYPGGITDPWTQASGASGTIPWFPESEAYDCGGTQTCQHTWFTNESVEDTFCYYAMAQETFSGKWSLIAYDKLQIGYIRVLLAFPRPRM